MRVLATGAAGFLGRAVVARLKADGHAVLATDRMAGDGITALDVAVQPRAAEMCGDFKPDAIVHLAALLTPDSRRDHVVATRVNALGTAIMIQAAIEAGATRIVYASSVAALGTADSRAGDATVPRPGSVYGATKAFAEHLATAIAPDHPRVSFVGLRFGWVYGPGRDRGWREVQAVIEAAARGETEITYPDYPDAIDWTWVEDAAQVTVRAVTAPIEGHRVFNVAGDKRRVAEAVAHLRRRFPAARFTAQPAKTPPAAWGFTNDTVETKLGLRPATTMEAGIDKLIAALRS